MFSSLFAASIVAALAPQAFAGLFITSPVASTSCAAGQQCTAAWNDDGNAPSLAQIGVCTVGIYVGSQQTQFLLQDLGSVDVSQQASATFTPDATMGGNSNLYFLRFTSLNLKDGTAPYQGFSAKFTLTGMTGAFNATEQSLMSAPTVALSSTPAGTSVPAGSTTPAGTTTAGGSSTGASSGVVTSTAKPTGSATSSHATSTSTSSTGAAAPVFGSSSPAVALAAVVSAFFAAAAF